MNLEKILTTFICAFVTFLLPHQVAVLALFSLVLLNSLAKTLAVINDEDVRFWHISKILTRSNAIPYALYSIVGYSIAISAIVLLEMLMFGGIGVKIGENVINLTFFAIILCVSHVFNDIFKSVEDIVKHPMFNKLLEKMPTWLQDVFNEKKVEKEKNDTE